MRSIYDSRQRLKFGFIFIAILIAITSLVVSDFLIEELAREERLKIEVWSEATRAVTSDTPALNMNLILKIIQGNTSIPAVLCDEQGHVISYNNIDVPERDIDAFMAGIVKGLKEKNPPVVIDLEDGSYQYIYYDDSIILKRLLIYPYVQLLVVFVFILIAFLALVSTKKAEQDKVWAGLSKETAHQLGTPVSSLIAWVELLRAQGGDRSLLDEMDKDVRRLEAVIGRFSKIGSSPDLVPVNLVESTRVALGYMEPRISAKVKIFLYLPEKPIWVLMDDSLFAWVVENLIKNAVDAMEGQGEVILKVDDLDKIVQIDITDIGKGIPKSRFNTVFHPGYTTKRRGWGLGLSLVKRIVESFNGGKIYVKSSEQGKGTTFCIELRKYKR